MENQEKKNNTLFRNILLGAIPAVGGLLVLMFMFLSTGDSDKEKVENPEKEISVAEGKEMEQEEEAITRAEAAKVIIESIGLEVKPENVDPVLFKDVNEQTDGYAEIAQLTEWGVFENSAEFKPNAPLKKSQLPKIIAESFSLKVDKDPSKPKASKNDYQKVVYDNDIIPAEFGEDKNVTKSELNKAIDTVEKVVAKKPEIVDPNKKTAKEATLSKNENLIITEEGTLEEVTVVEENTVDSEVGRELSAGQSKTFTLEDGSTVIVSKDGSGKVTTTTNKVVGSISEEVSSKPIEKETTPNQNPVSKPSEEVVKEGPAIDFSKNYSKHEDIQVAFEKALNQYREQQGLAPVKVTSNMTQAAGFRSWDMAENDYFSHVSPTYGGFGSVLEQFSPESPFGAEVISSIVIGRGAEGDARAALENFKSSPAHNDILLVDGYDKIGVGIETAPDGITTIFTVIIGY